MKVAYLGIPREARTLWFSAMRRFLASSYSFGVHAHCSWTMAAYGSRLQNVGGPSDDQFVESDLQSGPEIYGRANSPLTMIVEPF